MTKRRPEPTTPAAPRTLSAESRQLWASILGEFVLDDAASLALLRQLCDSLDGVRRCQAQVSRDGLMIAGSSGQLRPHPLLATEAEYRRAMLACCRALRLNSLEA